MTNKVIAGEFENGVITTFNDVVKIQCGFKQTRIIDFTTIKQYEVVTEENQKSMSSGIMRGIAGGMLLGGVGAVAGAMAGKNKGTYTIAIEFVDGKKSLVEVDTNTYKMILKKCFDSGKPKLTAEELITSEQELETSGKGKNLLMGILVLIIFSCIIGGIIVATDKGYIPSSTENSEQTSLEKK